MPHPRVTLLSTLLTICRSAYEVLDRARTSGAGTVLATVPVPAWAAGASPLVFVVASPERGLAVRSKPFEVTGPGRP